MTKTAILLVAGAAVAAAYTIARRRRSAAPAVTHEPVKKSRHLNSVFSHLKQEAQHS